MEYFAHHMGKLPRELQATDGDGDGWWSIDEFSKLCLELIKLHGDEKFRVLVEGLLESYAHKMKLHHVYWEGWALWFDWVCLLTLPALYTLAMIVLGQYIRNMPDQASLDHLS